MTQKSLHLSDLELPYVELNPTIKTTILMVHGFRGNHAGLLKIAEQLSGYRIIIPDLPGHGAAAPMSERRHDIAGFAAVMREFVNSLGLNDFILFGHSFGALVAGRMAADDRAGIRCLVLVNPVSESNKRLAWLGEWYYRLGLLLPPPLGRWWLTSRSINLFQSRLMTKTRDTRIRAEIIQHHLADLRLPFYSRVIAEAVKSVIRQEGFRASEIAVPTLIIGGAQDDLAPVVTSDRLKRLIPGARLAIIPGVGHLTHLEQPAVVARLTTEFIKTVESAARPPRSSRADTARAAI